MPGTEGLVHISELKHGRTDKTEDVVKKGDRVKVKLLERDERGRLRLSMKALVPKEDAGDGESPFKTSGDTRGNGTPPETAAEGSAEGGEEVTAEAGGQREDRPRRPRSRSPRSGGGRGRE